MGHKIRLDEPWRRIVPTVKGSHRHAAPDRGRWWRVTALSSSSRLPDLAQRPIDGGGAHRQQTRANLRRELKMAVPFHRIDQDRHQRPQPLAAHTVRRFPDHDQRLAHRVIIQAPPGSRAGPSAGLPGAEQTHRVLAMQATHRREFIENPASFLPVAQGVTSRQCNHHLVSCRHADPPHVRPDAHRWEANQMRQRVGTWEHFRRGNATTRWSRPGFSGRRRGRRGSAGGICRAWRWPPPARVPVVRPAAVGRGRWCG